MKFAFLVLTAAIVVSTQAEAKPEDYWCSLSKAGKSIALIDKNDLASVNNGHQYLYKKSADGLNIQVYRDTNPGMPFTSISVEDPKKDVRATANTESLIYTSGSTQYTLLCSELVFN
jgi:hypothetical protein